MKQMISLKAAALFVAALTAGSAFAAEPAGYYSTCEGKGGTSLLSALHSKISNHTTISYNGLWDLYKKSDVYPDGKIWDMYSTKHWNTGEKCGNYSSIGDCYNREHSMPKSWFNDASPMYSDAFHLYPTDGKVNGQRSNYPFGECANGTYVSPSGNVKALGRLGKSTFQGYSGTVFEPDDQYKGDFARSYFYMATCYYDRISSWKSDMLSGQSHPAFKSWAINLLLKWHREDPVSQKEIDRNEAVYAKQRNRNPFIDHPDMVEYIWGDKTSLKWTSDGELTPEINQPASGSTLDLGNCARNVTVSRSFRLQTTNASTTVTLSAAGTGYSVSPSSVSASTANSGTTFTISLTATSLQTNKGTLTVKCGDASSTVSLTAYAVDGLPLNKALQVTDRSFRATWTYVGDDSNGKYTIDVSDADGSIDGYPRTVDASREYWDVDGLQPATEYSVVLKSKSLESDRLTVRTADPMPFIDFLFDGDLFFETEPGEASAAAEILIDMENIESDYTVSVKAPFELSTDLNTWKQSLTLSPDEDRLYLRVNSASAGVFESSLTATYGNYVNDAATIRANVSSTPDFLEDFEAEGEYATYSNQTFYGTSAIWNFTNVGIWPSSDPTHSGKAAARFGKDSGSSIEMAEDRHKGVSTVSFFARTFNNDGSATLDVDYSTDGGRTYTTAGTVTVDKSDYTEYKVFVGITGDVRIRLQQTTGKRLLIDDVALTPQATGLDDPGAERHAWNAYSLDGSIIVEVSRQSEIAVYCIDGTTVFAGVLDEGTHSFEGRPGTLYIVAGSDFARRVLVK